MKITIQPFCNGKKVLAFPNMTDFMHFTTLII